jgi:hypothetical protein
MDNMLFPENCPTLVIVPSNKEGTGFLNHCYDERFLRDYITVKEFNAIVLITSKIAARAYSKKRLLDKKGMGTPIKTMLVVSTLMALCAMITIINSFMDTENTSQIMMIMSHVLIAPSLLIVFIVSIYNWKREIIKPPTFNEMVKKDLD